MDESEPMQGLEGVVVKENVVRRAPLALGWALAALGAAAAALLLAAWAEADLPPPLPEHGDPTRFRADIAHQHLVNLTSIGPRVAGSYENEVLAVSVVLQALRRIAAAAAPHNALAVDLHTASGAFPLAFFDGMNNVYRDVQSVVARVSPAGAAPRPARPAAPALLLNCHFDTVPDSPGASDDGAGCAVVLETLRALAARRAPLRRPVVALLNGAEENIMQASHAFITTHKWAKNIRAFINIEACGAGGREVLFQVTPRDPWIMEVYARVVPHPFASSLAQEIFESGFIPGDTDFRVFRDFGNLSGVDLAWNSNGYVYHTRLDTAARMPAAALQRTGDNVLALALGLLESEEMDRGAEAGARQGVFFDVLGRLVLSARPAPAALGALAAVLLVLLRIHVHAGQAKAELYVERAAWWRCVGARLAGAAAGGAAGAGAALLAALALHAAGARMRYYATPALLLPLYAAPAVSVSWWVTLRWGGGGAAGAGALVQRGWWRARATGDALAAGWALLLAGCAARALRSGFWPLHWALPLAAAGLATAAARLQGGARLWGDVLGCSVGAVQTSYLALSCVSTLVPLTARAGSPPLPADALVAVVVALLALAALSWLLPVLAVCRDTHLLVFGGLGVGCAAWALAAAGLWAPYSAQRPQRLMLYHVRRTVHAGAGADPTVETLYWLPTLDANHPHSMDTYVEELRGARAQAAGCARWPYCGAPYHLPVLALVPRAHWLPAPSPPLAVADVTVATRALGPTLQLLEVNVTGPNHVVVIAAPAAGARLAWSSAVPRPLAAARPWGGRLVYFFAMHDAAAPKPWRLQMHIEHSFPARPPEGWAALSVAGHAMAGPRQRHPAHARLLARLPRWAAATGWGVDLHLYEAV